MQCIYMICSGGVHALHVGTTWVYAYGMHTTPLHVELVYLVYPP